MTEEWLDTARRAWPAITVDAAVFAAYAAARIPAGARAHPEDLYLACACATGDPTAIAAFDKALLAPLPARLVKGGIARALADEVVQQLRARLFVAEDGRARIADYDGRGPLAAWVRVAAVRAASNQRRDAANRASLLAGSAPASLPASGSLPAIDPALALIRRRYGAEFQAAIKDAFATLAEADRNILRLHFTDGLDLAAIGRVLGISRATAGRRMLAAREQVRDETLRLLGERITATPAELESLLGAVRSTLDVSLGMLVA